MVHTEEGTPLRDLFLREGIMMDFPCGGKGLCGQCKIRIEPPTLSGKGTQKSLSGSEIDEGLRLACEVKLEKDCSVYIPEGKRVGGVWQDASKVGETHLALGEAIVSRRHLKLPEPSLEDQRSDWQRVSEALKECSLDIEEPDYEVLENMSSNLRENGWNIHFLVEEESALCSCCCKRCDCRYYGFAIDLGTTTVDLSLHNLETGRRIGRKTLLNRQTTFGADVISRALAFKTDRNAVRKAALDTIAEAASYILEETGVSPDNVVRSVVVGNPIMIHILHGLNPLQLTHAPYIPVISHLARRNPRDFGWSFQRYGYVESLPLISSFVGADTVGMILALGLGLQDGDKTTLSIDIGTNGELVLAKGGRLYTTSAAAGPAFEGAQIACGCRALPGAICDVHIDDSGISFQTLNGEKPIGICGTALIMTVARLLDVGLLESTGRLLDPEEVENEVLRSRLFSVNGIPSFALTDDRRVYITQKDIRELQLAKGAIRTAIEVLLDEVGLKWSEIDKVSLAGNFGAGMDVKAEMRIGLFPEIDTGKVDVVGNAALRGAALALLSRNHRKTAAEIPSSCSFLELAGRSDFQDRFADSMLF